MGDRETYVRLFFKGTSLLVPMTFVLNEHPGGAEYILQYANQDVTSAFEDMNHTASAHALLATFEEAEEEEEETCAKDIYNPEEYQRKMKLSHRYDEERRRTEELRRWRTHTTLITASTTLAAIGVAAFALRRHLQRS
ncbi:Cytochrome b5-like Heme/Steroid binding domain containing protein [Novymonas esmeraldas]|uniref:Cytochrome b5-like Heme/Steroid binding domain containing protein n=1 Tax=Novymonas esmeraldas TaxID=1808958 RepID=A0AAW0F103_9TRYP